MPRGAGQIISTRSFSELLGGPTSPLATNVGLFISMFFAGVLAAIAGFAVGVPSLRLKGDYLAIVTLGFGEIIRVAILNTDFLGASRGLSVIGSYTNLFWTYGSVVLCIYVVLSLVHSTYGRGFLTVRDDEVAAEAMGINTTKYKVLAFVVSLVFRGYSRGTLRTFQGLHHAGGIQFFPLGRCRGYCDLRRDGKHRRGHGRRSIVDDST